MKKLFAGPVDVERVYVETTHNLLEMFPEVYADGTINFDVLKELLGGFVEEGVEKYGLNWSGKRRARQTALTPSTGTLRPYPSESAGWDDTRNIIIEGDNLEVLKLLQKSYSNKVKLIFIDPPYNTGKDFVYRDNFRDNLANYLQLTGQVTEGREQLSSVSESSGRFHTRWLNMIYPRLKLARSLLRDDGVIFISIDDVEMANLKCVCAEIFGEENFVACIVWQKTYSPANDKKGIDAMHDFVLVYQRTEAFQVNLLPRTPKQDDAYTNPDNDPRGPWKAVDATRAEHRDYAFFEITTPSGKKVWPASGRSWVFTKEEVPGLLADNRLWFGRDGAGKPAKKLFLSEVKQGVVPTTWWGHEDAGHNDEAKKELKALFPDGVPFQTPKPVRLIKRAAMLSTMKDRDDIVLDFFAGTGTTGQAVVDLNRADGGNRRFILVQLPEPTGDAKYPSIADITKERLRRVSANIKAEDAMFAGDLGFRVFKLDSSNIRPWDTSVDDLDGALLASVEHLRVSRSELDILYELLPKLGLDLCVRIDRRSIAGKDVYAVGGGVLFACLSEGIGGEEVEQLALGLVDWHTQLAPVGEVVSVFRDSAFADDVAKTNLAAILDQHGL